MAISALGMAGAAGAGSAVTGLFNAYQAHQSRSFTKKMMKNKYQWQVGDMRKAGLNPILAATQGAGIGPSAAASMPDLGQAFTSGMQASTAQSQMEADVNLKTANTALTKTKNILAGNLVPGSEAIGTITKQLENLIKAADSLIGQSKAGYEEMLSEMAETVNSAVSKIKSLGGNATTTIQNIWYDLGAAERKGLEWFQQQIDGVQ